MFRVAPRLTEPDGGYPLELFSSKEVSYIQRFFRRLIENPGMLKLPTRSGANAAELRQALD